MVKKQRKPPPQESELEKLFYKEWVRRFPTNRPATEYKFHPSRQFRFDFAWVRAKVAVEVQGMGPGHCSLKGMSQDYDKLLEAVKLNWKVIYLTSSMISPTCINYNIQRIAFIMGLKLEAKKEPTAYIPLKYRRRDA